MAAFHAVSFVTLRWCQIREVGDVSASAAVGSHTALKDAPPLTDLPADSSYAKPHPLQASFDLNFVICQAQ